MQNVEDKGIILKNIDLTGYTLVQQLAKVQEEDDEFLTEIVKGNRKEAIEEYWDKMISRGLKPRVKGDK